MFVCNGNLPDLILKLSYTGTTTATLIETFVQQLECLNLNKTMEWLFGLL